MTDFSSPRRKKLFELHTQYLTSPMTSREVAKVERDYLKKLAAIQSTESQMTRALAHQAQLVERKKNLEVKHAAQLEAMRIERETLEAAAREQSDFITKLSFTRRSHKAGLDQDAERLVLANGNGPIVLDGVTYDFGCHGERVYLVRRTKQSLPRGGRHKGQAARRKG